MYNTINYIYIYIIFQIIKKYFYIFSKIYHICNLLQLFLCAKGVSKILLCVPVAHHSNSSQELKCTLKSRFTFSAHRLVISQYIPSSIPHLNLTAFKPFNSISSSIMNMVCIFLCIRHKNTTIAFIQCILRYN